MKVLILCSNYEPGGAQRVALRLNDSLNKKGIETQTWFLNRKTPDFTTPEPNLVYNERVSIVGLIPLWFSLIKLIRGYKPDVVLAMLPYANIIGLFTAWLCGVKQRIASHRSISDKELSWAQKKVDTLCANAGLYTRITAVSRSAKKSFMHYSKNAYNNITVIYNGLTFHPSNLSKMDCRKRFNLDHKAFTLGTIGRLAKEKNHLFLIPLLQEMPDTRLVIVGQGQFETSIQDRARALDIADRIQIIPEVRTEEVPVFLKCLDLFVMPSLFEGLSNAILEALFAGLPILSSDVPAQREVIIRDSDGLEAGIALSLEKPELWIEAIIRVKNDPVLRDSLSRSAMIRSRDFTVEKMTNAYINLFESADK